jgi:thiosulfate dehydrogenase [quinone] large subunit
MIVAFFESFKYVGHLFPVAFLRIFIGYQMLSLGVAKITGEYLSQPKIAEDVLQGIGYSQAPAWYLDFLQTTVVPEPYWQFFAWIVTLSEILLGVSFLLGYLVRPFCILGILISLNQWTLAPATLVPLHQMFVVVYIVLAWLGAGRCLGVDYFFYKRMRGIWW